MDILIDTDSSKQFNKFHVRGGSSWRDA